MNTISLCTNHTTDVTVISNIFIDAYMPTANGAYVKVYLYLLRCLTSSQSDISISTIADRLDNTEKDISRAISYWEKVNLISVTRNPADQITNITFNELLEYSDPSIQEHAASNGTAPPQATESKERAPLQQGFIPSFTNEEDIPQGNYINNNQTDCFDKPTYTQSQIETLSNHDEIKWVLNITEIYLERLLKPSDVQLILYLYEGVGFSAELIMYLYEYCVSKNKKNASYIEAVALSWANEGIDTVEKAEASTTLYNSNYNAVNKAFGLNRSIGNIEKQYVNKWLLKYSFSIELITEACNRTILRTGKPDFKYADKILENWNKNKVQNLTDVQKLDEEHNKVAAKQNNPASNSTVNNAANYTKANKFTSFAQRNYTKEDFSSMEQHLLNKQ